MYTILNFKLYFILKIIKIVKIKKLRSDYI